MSDFSQHGAIATLQWLNDTHLATVEARVAAAARTRPVSLILPCRATDLLTPSFALLCAELQTATWLREVIISLNGELPPGSAVPALHGLPFPVRWLWNDRAPLVETHARLLGCQPSAVPQGKGLNVWAALGVVLTEGKSAVVATQDCDVASFQRQTLARLVAPCVDPRLGFRLAKMYYSRVTDRLYGRVTRLFLAPLLRALLRVGGHRPLLDFLLAFRYALAGEVALDCTLASALELEPGWGLEAGVLCSAFTLTDPSTVCQVDGGAGYDHRHHAAVTGGALQGMCGEIARTVLAHLALDGLRLTTADRCAVAGAFQREAELALHRSEALAYLNDLPFSADEERGLVQTFMQPLLGELKVQQALPSWDTLRAAQPRTVAEFTVACAT